MQTHTQTTDLEPKITAANESRFSAAHYSEPLTAFTAGWKDNDELAKLLDFVAPTVEVGRRFEFKKANNAECFLSEDDDVRAIGASFKRVEYSGESVNEKTLNKGLTIRIDHDDIVGDHWRERYVHILLQHLYRNEIRRAIDALLSLDANPLTKMWAGPTASNPEGDVLEAILAAGDAMGVEPNRALFGRGAWQLRHQLYANGQSASAFAGLGMSPVQLAATLGLDELRVSKERYQPIGQSAKTRLLSDKVILFHARNVLDKDDPSNLKRFVTPTEGGLFRVYLDEQCKYTDITVEHYSNIITTSALGVKCLNITAKQ